jgi:hypothetical protein
LVHNVLEVIQKVHFKTKTKKAFFHMDVVSASYQVQDHKGANEANMTIIPEAAKEPAEYWLKPLLLLSL